MHTSCLLRGSLSIALIVGSSAVLAQEESEESETARALEEVTVTATRRGEADIMSIPVSITALDGDEDQKFALRDLNDIAVSLPGCPHPHQVSAMVVARTPGLYCARTENLQ